MQRVGTGRLQQTNSATNKTHPRPTGQRGDCLTSLPTAMTCFPGTNMRLLGFGVGCVWMNMVRTEPTTHKREHNREMGWEMGSELQVPASKLFWRCDQIWLRICVPAGVRQAPADANGPGA